MSTHQLDSAMNITLGAFEAVQAKNPNVIAWHKDLPYAWADPCPRELSLNTTVAPWSDPNMRKAVSLIIDRNKNIEIAYEGTTTASQTMFVQYGGMAPYIQAIVNAGYGISPDGRRCGRSGADRSGWLCQEQRRHVREGWHGSVAQH